MAVFAAKTREITCRVSVAFTVLPEACQSRQIGDILKTHIQLKLNFQKVDTLTFLNSQFWTLNIVISSILKEIFA